MSFFERWVVEMIVKTVQAGLGQFLLFAGIFRAPFAREHSKLYYSKLYYSKLHYTILYYTILYYTISYYIGAPSFYKLRYPYVASFT